MTISNRVAKTLSHIDHRLIGERQKLFFFNELSKGSCFFQPRGAHIYNRLVDYLRDQYKQRHYEEVITPNIYDCRLWQTSGHWAHYEKHMIKFKLAEQEFSLKPMNCPGHCLMFKNLGRISGDQLPVRWADFGALHRNELSGTLLGLSRVRRFQQDDAHIFCTPDQVESEVRQCLEFAQQVYTDFGFTFDIALSLRPEQYLGEAELWDQAEESLRQALRTSKLPYEEQPFEGAFYGPKIDLIVRDCHGRSQQCATIQLDFQLPQRFDLVYESDETGQQQFDVNNNDNERQTNRPVMIHRAILGSIERFIAMLAEHTGGRWPFWLSPLQALVLAVGAQADEYALEVAGRLERAGFAADCELVSGEPLNRRIRAAHSMGYNFILLVGDKEMATGNVAARFVVDKKTRQTSVQLGKLVEVFESLVSRRASYAMEQRVLVELAES